MQELHYQAKKHFNQEAERLVSLIQQEPARPTEETFKPDLHVDHTFSSEDIPIKFATFVDGFGDEVGFSFVKDKLPFGIYKEQFQTLQRLVEAVSRTRPYRDLLSQSNIRRTLFDWLCQKYRNQIDIEFSDYLETKTHATIEKLEMLVPIRFLAVQAPFVVGRVTFIPITRDLIDIMELKSVSACPDTAEQTKMFFKKHIRCFQGFAGAFIEHEADPERTKEILLEETQRSLQVLRIYSVSALHPRICCTYDVWGSERTDSVNVLSLKNGTYNNLSSEVVDPKPRLEHISMQDFDNFMSTGLSILSRILCSDSLTPFQEAVRDAVFIYARCTTATDASDKLLYVLVALESLLLKNDSEAIKQNLSERLAFLIGKSIDERKRVISDFKRAYAMRSAFVHHGATFDDYETLSRFMLDSWRAMIGIIKSTEQFKTKAGLIQALDDRKLS